MKLTIVETDDREEFQGRPLCYRVSLRVGHDEVTLTREFFRAGFHDGEEFNKFYFNNENNWNSKNTLTYCTFLTKNVSNKKYLAKKELELIKLFHERCGRSKAMLEKKLKDKIKKINQEINDYENIINHFEYINREDKLRKLISQI